MMQASPYIEYPTIADAKAKRKARHNSPDRSAVRARSPSRSE
jgi:hypothetical protein